MLFLGKMKRKIKQKFTALGHKERFIHTLGVAKLAKRLARQYGISSKKALIAAYFHDFCKFDSEQEILDLLKSTDIKECEEYPVLKHSYASAEYYWRYIGQDKEIYDAIRNHVFGRIGMTKLEEIILISDYTEENRKYPSCIHCRETLFSKGLNEAIYESTLETIEFLKKRNLHPHPLQIEVLKHYERLCKDVK